MKKYWKTRIFSIKTFIFGLRHDYQAVRNTAINERNTIAAAIRKKQGEAAAPLIVT